MTSQNKPPITVERVKTDGSLSVERKRADDALTTKAQETERDTDREVETVRAKIDESLAHERAESTLTLEIDSSANDQLEVERRRADALTATERKQADKTLRKERLDRRSGEHAFFADQRILTDRCLNFERNRTDLASAFAAKLLLDEQAAHTLAKAAITSRDEFLAIVSHDLRSPLAIILMCADELTDGSTTQNLSEEHLQLVEIVRRQAASMNSLIVDLLDIEHMVSGQLKLSVETCDLTELIEEAMTSFQVWAEKQGITLISLTPSASLKLGMDRDRMWQVLSNLIGNALKFTPEGGSIKLKAELGDLGVRVSVTDTGPGIAADQSLRIFERFSQIKNKDRRGVGLGLFIAKWIVEAHRGKIWVESSVGAGSSFIFALPLTQE